MSLTHEDRITTLEREQYIYHPWIKREIEHLNNQINGINNLLDLSVWEFIRLKIKWWLNG